MLIRLNFILLAFLTSAALLLTSFASLANDLPMTRFNYQGYAVDEKKAKAKEEDPNLIKIFTDPDLYLVINKLIDEFNIKAKHPFRIHQGNLNDLDKLLEEGYSFDLLATGKLEDAQSLTSALVSKVELLAVGRLALWAPGETSRSLNVLKLQTKPIAMVNKASAYHDAVNEALQSVELDLIVKSRLTPLGLFDDVYEKVAQKEFTSGFLPYSHLVEAGIQKRKDVLLINAGMHAAITHGLALTSDGQYSEPVLDFWNFALSNQGRKILIKAGFE